MNANVLILPSQPDGHVDPPQDTPQDTELEDTTLAHGHLFPDSLDKKQCVLPILALTLHAAHSIWMRSMTLAFFPNSPTGRASQILQ